MRTTLLLFALAVLAGCASTRPDALSSPLVGPTWTLTQLGQERPAGSEATIAFGADGRFNGTTGCNSFFGAYTLGSAGAAGAVELSQIGSTRMACAGPDMAQETRVLDALNRTDRVAADAGRLVLFSGSDALMTFTASRGAASATITGTAAYRERIALPPDAALTVRLEDAAGSVYAQTTAPAGQQVPIAFSLSYDPSTLLNRGRYAVRAEIRDARGALLWTTAQPVPVGTPSAGVQIPLVQATGDMGSAPAGGALVGSAWRLVEIRAASGVTLALDAGAPYTLAFGADGRYTGQADCNRISGTFEAQADGTLRLGAGLSTLAACPEPSAAGDYTRVLGAVDSYRMTGNGLTLTGADGRALVFEAG